MIVFMLIAATVILACVIFNKISGKLGIPTLLAFILLGMFFGSDGIVKIPFDNYSAAQQICTIALVFIMFYGGFGTNINEAKPIAAKSILLSSLGTILTAVLVGLFCHFVLKIALLESLLIGSIISSTDAASVFSILRSKHLNLKYNTASLLEVESGSNDPFSYMLTIIVLSVMNGKAGTGVIVYTIFSELVYGIVFGVGIAALSLFFMRKFNFLSSGFDAVFIVAIAIVSYAAPAYFGGNGYLSAYITGIILGNNKIENKQSLVHFFDGTTSLMQMVLFFLLGLLSFPSKLGSVAPAAIFIALFLTFVARPIAVFLILSPFKSPINQQLLVSWAGLRGAASIVFAIIAVINPAYMENDIFHIIFLIVLFSILFQGTLIPLFAKKLDMTDDRDDVMKTFTDYVDEVPVHFIQFTVSHSHSWAGKALKNITLPPDSILVLLIRDEKEIIPNGNTVIEAEDTLVLIGKTTDIKHSVNLYEKAITSSDGYAGKKLSEIDQKGKLVIMILRKKSVIIPKGTTTLREGDVLVINEAKK